MRWSHQGYCSIKSCFERRVGYMPKICLVDNDSGLSFVCNEVFASLSFCFLRIMQMVVVISRKLVFAKESRSTVATAASHCWIQLGNLLALSIPIVENNSYLCPQRSIVSWKHIWCTSWQLAANLFCKTIQKKAKRQNKLGRTLKNEDSTPKISYRSWEVSQFLPFDRLGTSLYNTRKDSKRYRSWDITIPPLGSYRHPCITRKDGQTNQNTRAALRRTLCTTKTSCTKRSFRCITTDHWEWYSSSICYILSNNPLSTHG